MFPETALVTGAAGGIGRALVALLEAEGAQVRGLDLADGFDVSDRAAWDAVEPADLVCLNAGVLARGDDSLEDYRRILGVNVDGVVFGTQALASRMRSGSAFVVTASLAGLIPMESDPLYVLTKHAVVGYARSLAPVLEPRGIRINLVCPGIVRTPMTEDAQAELDAAGFPLMEPEQIAAAILMAGRSPETGQAWVCQPGREPLQFRFPNVPGPRVEGAQGMVPRL
ncbi:MAG TPA: SDR family NAD(P)-dependent oxidoreductase [Gaiellaceae bacterium]|nr:SDR family NAD(P)-dependent oxidoreductase [Gaiellaceae bacterium]